ncbi:MAG TPA: RcpC/CpaB family pilus assembly protein [Mycobacteriales bacterium]
MSDPSSPPAARLRQPRWTDARLVAGILMVLLSVLGGSAVVDAADRSVQVWAVRRDLATGTTLTADDVEARRVRLYGDDLKRYVDVRNGTPAGRVLTRDLGAGDLLPVSALGDARRATRRVAIPLDRGHAAGGDIERGDRVDVLATAKLAGGKPDTYAVVRNALVVAVDKPGNGFAAGRGELVVVVEVDPAQALPLAAAIRTAEIDLSLVVPGADGAGDGGAP